jgi:hypothetical protein
MGGVVYRDSVSATAFLNLHSRFGRFVSALKIPFPGNGDFGSKRRGSNAGSSHASSAVRRRAEENIGSSRRLKVVGDGHNE